MLVIFGQQENERNVLRCFLRIQNTVFCLYTVELHNIFDVSISVIIYMTLIFRHLRIYLPSEFALALRLYKPV